MAVQSFHQQTCGAKILLKQVPDAERFGVAEIRGNHVVGIEEKPDIPKSDYAVIGVYPCTPWCASATSPPKAPFSTRGSYPQTLQALRRAPEEYKLGSLRYDLWKLRAKGLVERIPHSRRYRLLPHGYQICLSLHP